MLFSVSKGEYCSHFHHLSQHLAVLLYQQKREDSVIQLISSAKGKQCFPDTGRLNSFSTAE